MRRIISILTVFIMLFSMSACLPENIDPEGGTTLGGTTDTTHGETTESHEHCCIETTAESTTETTEGGTVDTKRETTVIYKPDPPAKYEGISGYEGDVYFGHHYVDFNDIYGKEICKVCSAAIATELRKQTPTGEIVPAFSDDEDVFPWEIPEFRPNTLSLHLGDEMYRIDPDYNTLVRVETLLGEGERMTFSEELKSVIKNAWLFCHHNTYTGTYKDGVLTLEHNFYTESTVQITVKDMHIDLDNPAKNTITVELLSLEEGKTRVNLDCNAGGCIWGSGDSQDIVLKANVPKTVKLSFNPEEMGEDQYFIYVYSGSTRVEIFIDVRPEQ